MFRIPLVLLELEQLRLQQRLLLAGLQQPEHRQFAFLA
jgi:hypothetical protein